jgi:hypothetical protein
MNAIVITTNSDSDKTSRTQHIDIHYHIISRSSSQQHSETEIHSDC